MNSTTEDRMREIIAETFDLNPHDIKDDASAQTVPSWTSLAHLRLMTNLEQAFDLRFTMDEMSVMTSLAAIEAVLEARGVHA